MRPAPPCCQGRYLNNFSNVLYLKKLFLLIAISLVLFIVLITANYMTRARFFPGTLLGLFLLGYGIFRSFAELFREPDSHIGFIFNNITMGQILSVPMIFIGILFLYMAFNYKNREFWVVSNRTIFWSGYKARFLYSPGRDELRYLPITQLRNRL